MTGRNRLITTAILLFVAIVAAAVYALNGKDRAPTDHPPTGGAPTTAAPTAGATGARAPSAGASSAGSTSARASSARPWVPTDSVLADVCQSRLPGQARDTLTLIAAGGPFPYRSDGVVFGNREGRLPGRRTGYYHEYTVLTPGSADRGTRRIVTGAVGEEYWTGDHYATFQEIDPRC
ncbi:ribonuclease domain-containing protein [Kitasatospora sp. NPDC050543]|uniref:ribonuclease domain-containing protein n=1 Tax=Kitasatospora sp. NPDC050543 TaxID=3364054 RepID=UPI0037A2AD84